MIHFELVSPDAMIMSGDVTMVVIPGSEGDFGVLQGHSPLISNVRAGVVNIYRDNMTAVSDKYFIAGGFADVNAENCMLVVEQSINVNDIDKADITRQINDITNDLKVISDKADLNRLEKRKTILEAMLIAA